jgi:hypothetical protein
MTRSVKIVGAVLVGLAAWFGLVYLFICDVARSVE